TVRVALRTENADRLVTRPERPARGRVTVVQRDLGVVERGLHPGDECVVVRHSCCHSAYARGPAVEEPGLGRHSGMPSELSGRVSQDAPAADSISKTVTGRRK